MSEVGLDDEFPVGGEGFHDGFIGGLSRVQRQAISILVRRDVIAKSKTHLDMHPLEIRHLLRIPPRIINRARRHFILRDNPIGDGDPVIVFTKGGGLVDNPGSRGGFDVGVNDDSVGAVFVLSPAADRREV